MSAACAQCGRAGPVSLRRETVRALLHWTDHAVDERPLCAACSRRGGVRAVVTTGLLGWWGWPGVRRSPGAVIRTVRGLAGSSLPVPLAWGFGGAALIVPLVAIVVLLAGVGLLFANDPAAAVRRAEQHAGEAQALLKRGDYEAALAKFRAALAETPGVPGYCYGAGTAAGNAGRPAEAEAWFAKAIAAHGPQPKFEYAFALGSARLQQKKAAEAIAPLEQALALRDDLAAHRALQDALRGAGKLKAAIERYSERLRDAPQSAEAFYLMARVNDPVPGRIALLERGLGFDPNHFWSLLALGAAHIEAGRPGQATPFLERAVAADPKSPKARFALFNAQLKDGRRDDAGRTLESLRRDFPGSRTLREAEKLMGD